MAAIIKPIKEITLLGIAVVICFSALFAFAATKGPDCDLNGSVEYEDCVLDD